MGFEHIQKIPTPTQIVQEMPLPEKLKKVKADRDKNIINVLKGNDSRFILIIGPCSADDEDALCEYVSRLSKVQDKVKDKLILIPRIYTNKPRTTGQG